MVRMVRSFADRTFQLRSWLPLVRAWHPFGTCPSFDTPESDALFRWVPPLDPTVALSYVTFSAYKTVQM